ncbi:hypothetical protein B0H10DRAFT_1967231 [Mycena sp. CBHHK59/15]|nr:hypothetical protein B0H10DRAFT_1967231 [Mycena sp. CBHHK59/15]
MQEEFWEDNVAAIKYSSGQWARSYGSIYHGSAIKFMGAQGWDHSSFVVNLDGEETTVDGYCCSPNGGAAQVVQFEATGLSAAEHILNVINLAAGPSGTVLETGEQDSQQMLPLSSLGPSDPERIPSAPVAPRPHSSVRPDKGAPQPYYDEVDSTAGASGSGSGQQIPPHHASASAAGPEVDDKLVECIAQRLARLVHNDSPPTYEDITSQPWTTR